jgi:spermidine/putrescine transport system substrate-binding protein
MMMTASKPLCAKMTILAAATVALMAGSGPSQAADTLNVLNWKDWGTDAPWALEKFEGPNDTKVVHDYFSSFAEAFTKLRTNPGHFDMLDLNVAFTQQAADEGLIQPIDVSKLKNYGSLEENFRNSAEIVKDGKVYGIAWIWGGTALAYDTDSFKTPPNSLAVLWDPANAGKVCLRDDGEDAVRFTALLLGQNPDKPSDMAAIKEKLRALKPQIKALFKTEDEWLKLVAAKQCALSLVWTTSVEIAHTKYNLPVSFVVPQEGAIVWRDALSIAANAPDAKAAYAFIDFLISPDFYAAWTKAGGAPVPSNTEAVGRLADSSLTKQVLTQPDALKHLHVKGIMSDDQRQAVLDLWQETKAYYAQ